MNYKYIFAILILIILISGCGKKQKPEVPEIDIDTLETEINELDQEEPENIEEDLEEIIEEDTTLNESELTLETEINELESSLIEENETDAADAEEELANLTAFIWVRKTRSIWARNIRSRSLTWIWHQPSKLETVGSNPTGPVFLRIFINLNYIFKNMHLRIKNRLSLESDILIFSIAFFYILASALLSPIYPLFVKNIVGKEAYVGFVISFIGLAWLITTFIADRLIYKIGKTYLLKISLLGMGVSFLALMYVNTIYTLLIIEFFRTLFSAAALLISSLMVRDSTTKNNIGKTEGIFFVVSNFSWLIGPFVGGIIAQAYGFKAMFFISGLFCFVSFFLSSNKSIKFKIIKNEA